MTHIKATAKDVSTTLLRFAKDWALPLSMLTGVALYFAYVSIPGHEAFTPAVNSILSVVQPGFIFLMLFVTFCKVRLSEMRLRRWHLWLLLFQSLSFTALALLAATLADGDAKIIVESAMICLICPTATAAVVITNRLGGSAAPVVTYTILCNLAAAALIPVLLPYCHPHEGLSFFGALTAILLRVFPLLICPLVLSVLVRRYLPRFHAEILRHKDLAFYLWVMSLSLAITVSTRSIVHTTASLGCLFGIALVSLAACLVQFAFGRRIGALHGDTIAGGQALGQKNTVFIIWLGYTYLTPVTAIAGGFYSIWHNTINSLQLYRAARK